MLTSGGDEQSLLNERPKEFVGPHAVYEGVSMAVPVSIAAGEAAWPAADDEQDLFAMHGLYDL